MQKTAKIKKSNLQQKNNEKQIINNLDIRSFYEDALYIELGKPNDKGFVQIHCPFHDDTSPSFSINLKHGGWKCFGECDEKGDVITFYQRIHNVKRKKAITALSKKAGIKFQSNKISTKVYNYREPDGKLVRFQTVRIEYDDGTKTFVSRRKVDGEIIRNLKGVELIPYNLHKVSKRKVIYICEGEKDCDNLGKKLKRVASTNPFGAGKWKPEFNRYFENKHVAILPDNDNVGRKHAENVAASLNGIAKSIKIVELPGLPPSGDVSDWIYNGGTKEQLIALRKKAEYWVPIEERVPDKVKRLNDIHAAVLIGNKFAIILETPHHKFPNQVEVKFLSVTDFKHLYGNATVLNPKAEVDGRSSKNISLSGMWLTWPQRRQYDRVEFIPGFDENGQPKQISGCYNLFSGFAIEPEKGKWSLFKKHIFVVIAKKNRKIFEWVLDWMAYTIQNPDGLKLGKAIVLRGGQGTGKGIFATLFGRIFGKHFLHISQQNQITGRFNKHFSEALLVFCDEGFWAGTKKAEGVIKALITEETIMCEPKGRDVFTIDNFASFLFASNSDWVVPVDWDDRRFLVLDVSEEYKKNKKYFSQIVKQMNNGGVEALLYDLLRRDVSKFYSKPIPQTDALLDQKLRSSKPVDKYWYERLQERTTISPARDWFKTYRGEFTKVVLCKYSTRPRIKKYQSEWNKRVVTDILYFDFNMFVKDLGISRHKPDKGTFVKDLKKLCPSIGKGRKMTLNPEGVRAYALFVPPLEVCRAEFEKAFRMEINWRTGSVKSK